MWLSLFSKLFSKPELLDFSVLQTDMHSHFVPGIDDGAKDTESTKNMLAGLKSLGFSKFITTPHIMPDVYENKEATIEQLTAQLNATLNTNIIAAGEYYIDASFLNKIKNDEHLLTFGENHILIEVSMGMKETLLDAVIFELTTRKYKPILAHVERYVYMFDQGKLDYYQQLKDADVLLQVNIRSFLGQYGEMPKKIARKLAVNNMIDYLGTDLHNEAQLPMIKDALNDAYIQNLLKGNTLKNNLL